MIINFFFTICIYQHIPQNLPHSPPQTIKCKCIPIIKEWYSYQYEE